MNDLHPETQNKLSEIHEFWEKQAATHDTDLRAVMPDSLLKELELRALLNALDPEIDTLEAGCGNGVNLLPFAETFRGRMVGFDYSEGMIAAAKKAGKMRKQAGVEFCVADILSNLEFLGNFPQIFTVRCLINLPSLDLQIQAAKNLATRLEKGGKLVLVECTQGGLRNINEMRSCVDLPIIEKPWHNTYIDEPKLIESVSDDLRHVSSDAFSSLYYLISRIFNAKLTPPGESPNYLAEINKVATQLPTVGDFGPHKLFVFEKIG
jgi:SAM-dependent methyltransferase